MNDFLPDVHLATYGPDRFPKPHPFGENGYLFTVPGSYPDDTPAHTNVPDCEMAVYRTTDDGGEWEVRDVNGNRRVWGTGGSRREAIGMAFLEIGRLRRIQAAEIGRKRAADGLEPVPPYQVETINSVTLVCAPTAIAVLTAIEGTGDTADRYHVRDIDGGKPYTIPADDSIVLRTTSTGVLHNRCDCQPEDAARFEQETQALVYAANAMTVCWPCGQPPKAQEQDATSTANDRPDGTPGEDAGNCAQCGRLLIWDGPGKRVHDEWGEYLCSPRQAGAPSSVHTLATPETTNAQPTAQG